MGYVGKDRSPGKIVGLVHCMSDNRLSMIIKDIRLCFLVRERAWRQAEKLNDTLRYVVVTAVVYTRKHLFRQSQIVFGA